MLIKHLAFHFFTECYHTVLTVLQLVSLTQQHTFIYLFIFSFLSFLGPLPVAYGGSQARGPIGAAATGLGPSHIHSGSEPCLRPRPQLRAMPDP